MALGTTRHIRSSTESWQALTQPEDLQEPSAEAFELTIESAADVVTARERGRALARIIGFTFVEQALVTSVISELTRNMLVYAKAGSISLRIVDNGATRGIRIVARDAGPGIADLDRALIDGFSTSGGMGLGLPGVRRLMDEFEIESAGHGTVVTATKWSGAGRHSVA
jgi:serine/threonine-protein kinase RsbT